MLTLDSTIRDFGNLCIKTQKELKRALYGILCSKGYEVVNGDGFLYAKGTTPILLTAHMDTVHKVQVKRYSAHKKGGKIIVTAKEGIGGDDRCGIYMILQIIKDGYRPSILFCEDEEAGGIGSRKFCATQYINDLREMNYLIELDRMNGNDAVFYDCDNEEFTDFIIENTGYKENWGSFSDISHLSPMCGVASVNLSCGYYNAHTTSEYVVIEEMENTIKVVEKLLDTECEQFEYIEKKYTYNRYGYGYYDNYYDDYYYNVQKKDAAKDKSDLLYLEAFFMGLDGRETSGYGVGHTENECWGDFFINNSDVCWNQIIDYDVY